jgi:hypothetical protein
VKRAAVAVACLALAGCGAEGDGPAPPKLPAESSWQPGQGSLRLSPAYLAIASRAESQGDRRLAAHLRRLEMIDARKEAARRKEREDALRRYRLARARALAKYRAALAKAERERKRQLALMEKRHREAEARRRAMLEKLRVPAGKECELPEVRRLFDCSSGLPPLGGAKKKR